MAGNEQKIEKIVAGGGMGAGIVGVGKMLGVDGGGIDATMGGQGVKIGVRSDTSLPSLKPSTAGEEINGFGKVLEHVVQGKVLPKGLSSNLLEEADLLRHSQGLEQQARAAGEVNRRAAQQLPSILGQLRNMASGAVLAAQQRWSMDKGLSLIKMAGSDGLLDSNQATLMAETYQNGMRQDRLNQLLEENPADAERQMQEDPLLQEMKQEERELFLKRLARRRETQPLDQAWRQVRMPQAHNRLEQTMQQSDYYIKQAQEGLLPPSLLGDLEVRRALPAFTMNLVGQFSSTAMKQSARHQAYITRMQQGVETTPLDPSNQDDVNAADYYYQLSYGNTPPQQLAERLPDLIALTKIVPPSAKASISRLLHGRDGVKFGQRLADVWINNPNVAHQLPDEVLLHSFAANTLLPNWRLGGNMGQGDDQDHRLYYLLNPLALVQKPSPQDNSLQAIAIQESATTTTLLQRKADLQSIEYHAAKHPDSSIRQKLQELLAVRRQELAEAGAGYPPNLRIINLAEEQLRNMLQIRQAPFLPNISPELTTLPRHPEAGLHDLIGAIPTLMTETVTADFLEQLFPFKVSVRDGQLQDEGMEQLIEQLLALTPDQLAARQADPIMTKVLAQYNRELKPFDDVNIAALAILYNVKDLENFEFSDDPDAGNLTDWHVGDKLRWNIQETISLYQKGVISYDQFRHHLDSLRHFRLDQQADKIGRLFWPKHLTPMQHNQQLAADISEYVLTGMAAAPLAKYAVSAIQKGAGLIGKWLFTSGLKRVASEQVKRVARIAKTGIIATAGTAGIVSEIGDVAAILAKHPAIQPYLQKILGAKTPEELHEALDKIAQFGSGAAVLGMAFMRVHQPRIAHNMAGGGKIADIGMQHPSNPNMMQMGQSGGNGNTPTNVPSSTQNTPLTPNTSIHPLQPGTSPNQPPNNPLNQANPNSPSNAPGSPQDTPLQNIKGTIYSQTRLGKPFHEGTVKEFDNNGGHIYEQHIDMDDDHLLGRANPPKGHKVPPYISRFYGGTPAERALYGDDFADKLIQEALRANENLISRSIQRGRNQIKIRYSPNKGPIGRGVMPGGTYVEDIEHLEIIIRRDRQGLYYIKTAYPVKKSSYP